MRELDRLYKLRSGLDARRQPSNEPLLQVLRGFVAEVLGHPHPFWLNVGEKRQLARAHEAYRVGARGSVAHVTRGEHVYRITGIREVMENCDAWTAETPSRSLADKQAFEILHSMFTARNQWLSMSDFAMGVYANSRNFTWWTTSDEFLEDPVQFGNRCGLLQERVPSCALILRIPLAGTQEDSRRVPTTIDAFDGEIFLAAAESPLPAYGITIDLRGRGKVTAGVPEVVLQPIPVSAISFRPVPVTDAHRRRVEIARACDETWRRINSFYEELLT